MKTPTGMTEAQVLQAIENVVSLLAHSFVFGYYDIEDMKQQGRLFILELLEKDTYDPSRPFENYAYTHCRRRMLNFLRDKCRRNDPPCPACHAKQMGLADKTPHSNNEFCSKYIAWRDRNNRKANLIRPLDLEGVLDDPRQTNENSAENKAELSEALKLIDLKLPVELRAAYLQMRAGEPVPKARRIEVIQAIKELLGESNG